MQRFRLWLWALWHTRPGHLPHVAVFDHSGRMRCGACGSLTPE